MRRYFHLCPVLFFLGLSLAQTSFSSDAYIKVDDNGLGQGILRQRGFECLLITPAHVVENAFKIDVTVADKTQYAAEIVELFPGDISVLRIKNAESAICRNGSWSNTGTVNALLEKVNQGELRTMLADGSIRITPVDIVGYDPYRYIHVRPIHASDAILKGESGSLLYISGQLSGMLLSVKDDTGIVLRQDALANTLALFFKDTDQAGKQGAQQLNRKTTAPPPAQEKVPAVKPAFSGTIAESAVEEHSVTLEENSPVRLTFSPTGDMQKYSLEIWDSTRKIVYRNPGKIYSGTESVSVPFTPPKNDIYTLHIIGVEGQGKYAVEVQTIARDSQLRSPENILRIGEKAEEGILAPGAVAEYRTSLEENSPVRLQFPATGDTGQYTVEIRDSTGKAVYRNPGKIYSGTESVHLPFTPPRNDTYTLHILGTEGEGRYAVRITSIALNSQLRSEANVIQVGGNTVEGVLAQGAVAEYRLELEAYTPIRLNFSATGDQGKYNVEIFDSSGNVVYRDPFKRYSGTETAILPFTVSKKDTYVVRLTGMEGECRYSLNIVRAGGRS